MITSRIHARPRARYARLDRLGPRQPRCARLKHLAHRGHRADGVVSVSVPDDEKSEVGSAAADGKAKVRESIRIQAQIGTVGSKMRMKVWVLRGDRGRVTTALDGDDVVLLDSLPLMVQLESSVLGHRFLDLRIDNNAGLKGTISAWETEGNDDGVQVHWRFTVSDGRPKMHRLYIITTGP